MRNNGTSQLVQEDDQDFARFWEAYPKRVAKKEARKAWAQLKPNQEIVGRILRALAWQVQQPAWLKDGGQFIPYPATWLRAERWDDEPVAIPQLNGSTVQTFAGAAAFLAEGKKNGSR